MTLPRRIARRAWRELRGHWPPLRDAPAILMYHRVDEPPWDPWGLCVPPAVFRDQIRELSRRRTIVSMDELADGLAAGRLPRKATAVTFDDGYADNLLVAAPILDEFAAPATVFLASGFVSGGERFWWDELARIVLAGRAAAKFELEIGQARIALGWTEQQELPADLATWRVGQPTDDPRRLAYVELWRGLQQMSGAQRRLALDHLRAKVGPDEPIADDPRGIPVNAVMIRQAASRISFGSHGRSHTPLTALPVPERRAELELARSEISELAGRLPSGLAYPHGSVDRETRDLAAEAGYRWAVTTRYARIDRRRFDPLALPRLDPGRLSGRAMLRAVHVAAR